MGVYAPTGSPLVIRVEPGAERPPWLLWESARGPGVRPAMASPDQGGLITVTSPNSTV